MATDQTPRQRARARRTHDQLGIGIDASGGPVVDPTENVRELVLAESKYQDALRESVDSRCEELNTALRELIDARLSALDARLALVIHVYDQRLEVEDKNRAEALKQAALNIQTGLDKTERLLAEQLIAVDRRMSEKLDLRFENAAVVASILEKLNDEKFASIGVQFRERDTRAEQTSRDSKTAVDAALQAAKEAVGEQNKSSAMAIAKSEASTAKQLDQLAALIAATSKATDDKGTDIKDRLIIVEGRIGGIDATEKAVSDLKERLTKTESANIEAQRAVLTIGEVKERLTKIESGTIGHQDAANSARQNIGSYVAVIAVAIAAISMVVTLMRAPPQSSLPTTTQPQVIYPPSTPAAAEK